MTSKVLFAYGSLLNRETQDRELEMLPAELTGWVRQWGHCVDTKWGKVCALTISRQSECSINGAWLLLDESTLNVLDEREIGYERTDVGRFTMKTVTEVATDALTFTSLPAHFRRASSEHPIWRSYVDVVGAGFIRFGGERAWRQFVLNTEGWDSPTLDDRAQPRYPRRCSFLPGELNRIQSVLDECGVRFRYVASK